MTASGGSTCLTDEEVTSFVEGLLSPDERSRVQRHLAQCTRCEELASAAASRSGPCDDGAPLAEGARVGRYAIVGLLGAGAMGIVYAARDPALDRNVALKVIRAQVAGPALEARLLREAKAMARLSHPEVITVFDAGRDGDRLFIAMELVDGGTLREWLRAAPRTSREILGVYMRAGRGLAQAHAAGIVHRDFKPDNVLVGADGRVRVTDFGLARAETSGVAAEGETSPEDAGVASTIEASLTRTGALVGTPVYMAPEQLSGCVADVRSDVYGFCVALYEALYGERPFAGSTLAEITAAKRAGDVRPAPAQSTIPLRLRRVLLKGLSARPEARYPSVAELLDALEWAAKRSRRPFVIGATAAVVIGGATLIARGAQRAPAPARPAPIASPAVLRPASCASHRACVEAHGGAPWVCRASDKTCVPIASEDCTAKLEPNDLLNEDTVWIGGMFPTKGPSAAAFGAMTLEGADLARKEIAHATRALEGPDASLHVPRVALVACDDSVDPARAARHLVDDVGVPAIVGFGSGQTLVDLAGSLLIPRGVLAIASLTSSPFVTRVPQAAGTPRMVWRTTYSFDVTATAIAHLIPARFEPRLASRHRPLRVALVRPESSMTQSFAETLYEQLSFNGKPALANAGDYRQIAVPPSASPVEVARFGSEIAGASPDVVVSPGGEVMPSVVEAVEAGWKPGVPRPTYLFASDSFERYASFLGSDVDRRRRFFVVESVSSSSSNARFVMRYNDAHADKVTQTFNPCSTYDAFYVAAYAVFALQGRAVSGAAIAQAIGRLVPPGAPIDVGPNRVFDALETLDSGRAIDLQGTASGLDFDLATGEPATDFALLCAAVDTRGKARGEGLESGVVYRAKSARVDGTMRCP